MPNAAIRLQELPDDQLEEFIETWLDRKGHSYHRVERIGAANDKGRDVVAFLTDAKYEGPWHLYQSKRKTLGAKLGLSETIGELGKVFHHHVAGAYRTLPEKYVFVSPRGLVGSVRDLIGHPTDLKNRLVTDWERYCTKSISKAQDCPLTDDIRAAIEGYDFKQIDYMTAPLIVKDPAAGPALTKVLGELPQEAPMGLMPAAIQSHELEYIDQLRRAYEEDSGLAFADSDAVMAHADHGQHLRDQRARFYDAEAFVRFHRDNTHAEALSTFEHDVYHGVVDVYRRPHARKLHRVNEVMVQAASIAVGLIGRTVRPPVKQGICHHFANDGRMKWNP